MTKLLRITVTIIDSPLFKTKIMTLLMTFMSLRYYTAICQACGLTTAFQYMLYSMLQWIMKWTKKIWSFVTVDVVTKGCMSTKRDSMIVNNNIDITSALT